MENEKTYIVSKYTRRPLTMNEMIGQVNFERARQILNDEEFKTFCDLSEQWKANQKKTIPKNKCKENETKELYFFEILKEQRWELRDIIELKIIECQSILNEYEDRVLDAEAEGIKLGYDDYRKRIIRETERRIDAWRTLMYAIKSE